MEPYVLAADHTTGHHLIFPSSLHTSNTNVYDITKLTGPIAITLPYTDDAHVALRHIHTINLNGHHITVAIPGRLFDSDAFVPYTSRHSYSTVDKANALLQYVDGKPVPGHQTFHVLKLTSNQHSLNTKAITCAGRKVEAVDLICTMPVRIRGARLKALVDTASNHSIICVDFLNNHGIPFQQSASTSQGISGSAAPCLGTVKLSTCIGRHQHDVMYTVVSSLPSAEWHSPNEALLGLDVISATRMKIEFDDPVIRIHVPTSRKGPRKRAQDWQHVIHVPKNDSASSSEDYACSTRQLKSMVNRARSGKSPLYVVHIKPSAAGDGTPAHACAASKKRNGFLSQQQVPAPVKQDSSTIPSCVQTIVDKHSKPGGTLGPAPPNTTALGFEMNIETLPGTRPRAARQYRLTPLEHSELEKQIQHLLSMGWIQPSISPWASSVLFAPKPGGKLRLCVDYRYLNENTVKNTYPLPRIDALLDKLKGQRYFSALDLASGYHQIQLAESSQPKTAFRTPDGLYEWTVMPFGLTNAPSVFQQAMHVVLRGLIGKICLAYLDDIIIISKSAEEHAENLDLVLTRLHEHNFFCNAVKCQFAMQEVKYLGHIVTADIVKPDPHKVSVLQQWPVADLQSSPNSIRSFLGLAGYFRRFIPKFPTLAAPLLERVKAKGQAAWTEQCTKAFNDIKQALVNATGLHHPDLNASFHVYTDASDYAYGAVLMQDHDTALHPVAWIGRKMNSSEVHHATFEKELGAIVFAARQWRCYLENGHPVYIHSDHNPLRYLQTQQRLNSKQARWVETLSRINWQIMYVPGDKNVVADAVSRATHLPAMTVPLHDSHPITCVSINGHGIPNHITCHYPAITLITLVARRCHSSHFLDPSEFEVLNITNGSMDKSPGPPATRQAVQFRDQLPPISPPASDYSQLLAKLGLPPGLPDLQCRSTFPNLGQPQDPRKPSPPITISSEPDPSRPPPPPAITISSTSHSQPAAPAPTAITVDSTSPPSLPPAPAITISDSASPPPPAALSPRSPQLQLPTSPRDLPPTPSAPRRQSFSMLASRHRPARTTLVAAAHPLPCPTSTTRHRRQTPSASPLLARPATDDAAAAAGPDAEVAWADSEDMILDGRAIDALHLGAHSQSELLQQQSNKFLTLDLNADDFWRRLRIGYAHDCVFENPPNSYQFDPKLEIYMYKNKIVVPDHDYLRRQILLWHHAHPWHAHMGVSRTASLITDSFYWPNIHQDVKDFVSQCHSCQTMKAPSEREAVMSPLPVPSACWRIVSVDMITQLPTSTAGHDCVVVFVDQFSKMVRLIPTVSSLTGPGFAAIFFQQIYPHYGLPLGICSDRGTQWNNNFFKSLCAHLGVSLQLTFSYHPRANGQVERYNRVIEEALRHFIGPAHDDWDDFLPHIEFSMNSSKSSATGCTPFSLNRITPPLSPTALAFKLPQHQQPAPAVLHRMYYFLAKQALEEAKQSMWSDFNKKSAWHVFKLGDLVLLSIHKVALHHPSLRKKFAPRWLGPCKILEIVGRSAARIALPSTLQQLGLHDVFHFSVLKPYHQSFEANSDPDPTPVLPSATVDTATYEVECVIDYMKARHRDDDISVAVPHYLVRWVGYSAAHDTWLPVDELSGCLEKVADYLFHNAARAQRCRMVSEFPREARMRLSHIVAKAESTRRPLARGKEPAENSNVPTSKPRRQSSRLNKSHLTAVSRVAHCSNCGRVRTESAAHER